MAKNKRQPYAVSEKAGHQTSAESWGTGEEIQPEAATTTPRGVQLADIDHNRSCCGSYPSCLWRWYASRWSGRLRKHVSFGAYVRTYQSMEKVASKDQSGSEVRLSIMELKELSY